MHNGHGHELPPKFLQIKKKERSNKAESSFRVLYYGGNPSSVPFKWESQPGTPKHPTLNSDYSTSLPPLPPPPSYHFASKLIKKCPSKSNFLRTIFPKIFPKKKHLVLPPLLMSSTSVSSSSCYSPSTLTNSYDEHNRRRSCSFLSRSRSTIQFGIDGNDDDQEATGSSTLTLCFGSRHGI
ncbi:uncharacterized protein LOC132314470 [Cornus florida]|uniref:uncharacterized protein LOC132314470 n=1 Tax=Cornus florida TaxID=4283 RepID=UPI00289D346F|nr:uncharacterized protein LOC132314470 [Cornus florida]